MNDSFSQKARMWDDNPLVIDLAHRFSEQLNAHVGNPAGLRILEFGCGTGLVGLRYAETAAHLFMVDSSPAMLEVLKTKSTAHADNVTVLHGNLSSLVGVSIPPRSLDWIISNMALHHVDDILQLLKDFYQLLKPGGRVNIGELATEPGTFHKPETVPHNGFAPHSLEALFADAGFTVNSCRQYMTMHKEDSDAVSRNYPVLFLDAVKTGTEQPSR